MSNNFIEIIELFGKSRYEIVPSKVKRDWMAGNNNNAYKCKPMNVANTYGWSVLCPVDFSATWNGGDFVEDLSIQWDDENFCPECIEISSHFGIGILTFKMDFIIRTPDNISTYITHPQNTIKDGMQPLDAIVETDWIPYTFTYNLKFTRPGTVEFKKGEVIYNFFPIERGFIESFKTKISDINSYPELQNEFEHFNDTRFFSNSYPGVDKPDNISGFYTRGENSMGKKYNILNHFKVTILNKFISDKNE